jgi:RNA polymerase sigma factor (sigma-70 family)
MQVFVPAPRWVRLMAPLVAVRDALVARIAGRDSGDDVVAAILPGTPRDWQPVPDGAPAARRADRVVEQVDAEQGQRLLGLAIRSGLSHAAAEDAVQEALLRLWLEVRKGVDVIDPRAWVFRTLYRLAMDEHRVRRRAADIAAQLSTRSWSALDPDVAERISIWTLVDRLPTRQRQVIYLRYRADLNYDQIAAIIGITASAARAHATFAATRLRAALGDRGEQ